MCPIRATRGNSRFSISAIAFALVLLAAAGSPAARAVDIPWNYAVQVTASVDDSKGQVTLSWPAPEAVASNGETNPVHTVYRKPVTDLGNPDWGSGTTLPAGQNYFVDALDVGTAYEYKVTRTYGGGDVHYDGVGFVRTGIRIPLVENRGTVLLVVESGIAGDLQDDLKLLTTDLGADGWRVVRIDGFSAGSNPSDLRARIRQEYSQAEANVQAVFLFGHLPVVMSGTQTNPDGHFVRSVPADAFYGDMNGDWGPANYDGGHWVFQRNTFPSAITLAVGRVDFADLPEVYAVSPFSSEVALLKNYVAKEHAFRLAQRVPSRRALIGDAFGEYYFQGVVEPFSAEAYRNFPALVGDQIVVADNFHGSMKASTWLDNLSGGSFLWAYGGAAGGDSGDSIASLAPNGVTSADLVTHHAQADFYLMFGSFMVDWTKPNNLLRATLAPSDFGLACVWAGRPFLYFHSMALGETIGAAFRLSENESGSLYSTPVVERPGGNTYQQGVYLALLGDPTLRLDPVPPVAGFASDAGSGTASWSAPGGVNVFEYRVYQQASSGAYVRVATLPASAQSYTPTQPGNYQVRVVTLQQGTGTYFNASEGTGWSTSTSTTPPPPPPPANNPPPPPSNPDVPPPPPSAINGLINLSSRLRIGATSGMATAGFVVRGDAPVTVLVRAVGPGLSHFGVSDPVPDPQLRIFGQNEQPITANAGWNNDDNLTAAAALVGAFKLDQNSADAAVLLTLNPGAYTAEVQSSHAGTVLVEVYSVPSNSSGTNAPVINLSTRGMVGTGVDELVGGFVVSGANAKHVLIRAIGPGLTPFGVAGTLADPVLTLRDGQGNVIAHNNDWESPEKTDVVKGPTPGDIREANQNAGAFPLTAGSKDSALVVQLNAGNYTATVEGENGTTGAALLEVYELP